MNDLSIVYVSVDYYNNIISDFNILPHLPSNTIYIHFVVIMINWSTTFDTWKHWRQVSTFPAAAIEVVLKMVDALLGLNAFLFILYGHSSGLRCMYLRIMLIHQLQTSSLSIPWSNGYCMAPLCMSHVLHEIHEFDQVVILKNKIMKYWISAILEINIPGCTFITISKLNNCSDHYIIGSTRWYCI